MKTDETKKARVIYPEYWAKRKKRLNAGFIKMLEETAQKKRSVPMSTENTRRVHSSTSPL